MVWLYWSSWWWFWFVPCWERWFQSCKIRWFVWFLWIEKSCLGKPLLHCFAFCVLATGWTLTHCWSVMCFTWGKEKKRKQNIGKRLSVGLDHCISIAGCISHLNYCVAGGAMGGWSLVPLLCVPAHCHLRWLLWHDFRCIRAGSKISLPLQNFMGFLITVIRQPHTIEL